MLANSGAMIDGIIPIFDPSSDDPIELVESVHPIMWGGVLDPFDALLRDLPLTYELALPDSYSDIYTITDDLEQQLAESRITVFWMPADEGLGLAGWLVVDSNRNLLLDRFDAIARVEALSNATEIGFDAITAPSRYTQADFGAAEFATEAGEAIVAVQDDPFEVWLMHALGGNDTITGSVWRDYVDAGAGNDQVSLSDFMDFADLGAGDDEGLGGAGADTIRGGAGNDSILGNSEDDLLEGGADNDTLKGGKGNDLLSGEEGQDLLRGGGGDDTLNGGAGDDTLSGDTGDDLVRIDTQLFDGPFLRPTIDIGDGFLTIDSDQGIDRVTVDVETLAFSDVTITYADLVTEVQNPALLVMGTGAGENLLGTTSREYFFGLGGADWILPGGGNDTVDGGNGRDMLSLSLFQDSPGRVGGQFRVYVDMEEGVSENHDGSERMEFTSIERLTSTIYTDLVRGSDGDDQIRTLGDYDWIVATEGNDTYDGGTGNDMISFLEFDGAGAATPGFFDGDTLPPGDEDLAGVRVDLTDAANNSGLAADKTLISIERVTGSSFQDVFVGDDSSNNFRGMGGYDWFVASDGGRERYFGGNGVDTVTYHIAPDAITASLINGTPNDDGETGFGSKGWARKDLYFSIENLVGSDFDDSLEGSSAKNQLSGMDGDDIIFGLGGGDQLKGGLGDDTLNGGAGSDRAIYDFDRDEYTLTRTAAKTVTISHATEGTDSLQDVEYFEFADVTVDVWSLTIV